MHERVLRLLTSGSLLSFAAVLAVLACGPRLGLPEAVTAKLADAMDHPARTTPMPRRA